MPTDQTMSRNISDTLKLEAEVLHSRDAVSILAGQDLSIATVLGKVSAGSVPTTGTAGGSNVGDGTCTSVTGGKYVKVGTYTLTCIETHLNTGVFSVKGVNGEAIGTAYVAEVFTSAEINFTLNDGATDFAAGDVFTIAVPAGGGQYRAINFSGVDGSAIAAGILFAAVDASASGEHTLAYTSGGTYEIQPGDIITGATSGATARVVSVGQTSGTWAGGDAAGTFVLDTVSGTFQAENLNVGANSNVATIGGASTAVAAADKDGVAVVRDAEIIDDYLVWPSGATAAQKAQAITELAALGIIVRDAA